MTIRTLSAGGALLVCVLLASVLLVWLPTLADAQDVAQKIKSLQIRGNKKIEETAIRGRLTVKVDDPYTSDVVRAQVRVIYEMGFFEDVQIETEPVAGGIALIEWPERLGARLWPYALKIWLEEEPSGGRRLTVSVPPSWEARCPFR